MSYIVRNLLRLRKSLTRNFSPPVFPARAIRLIRLIRPANFLIRPERQCETAILERSSGPNENLKEALLQTHLGRIPPHFRKEKPPLGGWGAVGGLAIKKKGNAFALPLLMQRYNTKAENANASRKYFTLKEV